MANEAVIVELLGDGGDPIDFVCGDGGAIAKGTVLWFGDDRICSGASTKVGPFAGIAEAEKVASDGQLRISCITHCIANLMIGTTVTAGTYVKLSGQNIMSGASGADADNGYVVGKILETGANGSRAEVLIGGP